ncbi:MAG TPA: TraM recognition domain-containing protein [bacterium]|jgi:type IV secretory pathway TraG/TraD family ATPase VirD4|nr:TraM recognition domain-containing protein [bacterium]
MPALEWIVPGMAAAVGGGGLLLQKHHPHFQKQKPSHRLNPEQKLSAWELGEFPLMFTPPPKRFILGEEARYYHLECIGASGTGKNRFFLLPCIYQDILRGVCVIVIDPKSVMLRQIAAYAASCGRSSQLRYLDLANPARSFTYSPFTRDDPSQMAESLYTALFQDDTTPTPFYRETAQSWAYGIFAVFHHLKGCPTFEQIRRLALDQDALKALLGQAPDLAASKELRQQFLTKSPQEYTELMQGVANKLTAITSAKYAPLVNTTAPGIDLGEVLSKNQILYVGTAKDQYPSSSRLISTLLLLDLQSRLTPRFDKPVRPCFLYIDEFADVIYPDARDLIAKARAARVGVTFAHQTNGDLKKYGPAVAEGIFDSAGSKVIFRLGAAETAELFAKLAGTWTEKKDLVNFSLDGRSPFAGKVAKGVTTVEGETFLIHPNAMKNLPVGEAYMILQRLGPRQIFNGRLIDVDRIGIPPLDEGKVTPPAAGQARQPIKLDLLPPKEEPPPGPPRDKPSMDWPEDEGHEP